MASSVFGIDTEPIPAPGTPGRFHATLTENWNAPFLPHGGLTAAFGEDRTGFAFTDATMPDPLPPERCRPFDARPDDAEGIIPAPPWTQVEGRMVAGHAPWEPREPGTSEQVYWCRFRETPRLPDGTLDPLGLLVLGDTMLGAVSERMGTGLPRWLAPSVDLTVRLHNPPRSEWVLARNVAHEAGRGYVSLDNELWDADQRTLVATATQLAFFSFPDKDVHGMIRAPGE